MKDKIEFSKTYKLIESEEEYNNELKWFKDAIKIDMKEAMLKPNEAYNRFMDTLDRAEGIGLFDKQFCDEQRMKIINALKNKDLKEKIKKYLNKKGILK